MTRQVDKKNLRTKKKKRDVGVNKRDAKIKAKSKGRGGGRVPSILSLIRWSPAKAARVVGSGPVGLPARLIAVFCVFF